MGTLGLIDAGTETLDEYVVATSLPSHAAHLAPRTRQNYVSSYDRHIAPRLGGVPLREIDSDLIAAFQGELLRAEIGPQATRKAMTLLGGILQRAAENKRIPYNPHRVVRKARFAMAEEVRPLAPITVERMRFIAGARDATILSVLAYAGLRPGELRGLRWGHVKDRTLVVNAPKTGKRRAVRLLAPLVDDLAAWRALLPDTGDATPLFSDGRGGEWSANGFEKSRQRRFSVIREAVGMPRARPHDLRRSFASLRLHERRDVIYVSRQLGHGAELTLRTYGHVISELKEAP